MSDDRPRSADFVQSLERGLLVIRAFDAEHRELGLSEVARISGLTRAAARRFLLTLAKLGYVTFNDGRFSLTPRVLELGYAYLSSLTLPEVALPHMEALVAQVNESSSISVLDDTEIVYVARVPTSRIMRVAINVGTRFPAHATSMGRVQLAALSEPELEGVPVRVAEAEDDQRPEELVPHPLEREDRHRGERRRGEGEHHAPVGLEVAGAVELRRLLEVLRDRQEVLTHQEQVRRQDEVDRDEPLERPDQVPVGEHLEDGYQP